MGSLTVLPGGGGPKTPAVEPSAAVRLLRRVLELAEAGDVHGIALAWMADDGISSCYVSDDGGASLLGAVTVLQGRMIQDIRS